VKVRVENLGVEGRYGGLPRLFREALLDDGGLRQGDELVEADDGVRERDDRAAGAQDVLLALDVTGGLQDVQRVSDGVASAGVEESTGRPGGEAVVGVRSGRHRFITWCAAEDGVDVQGPSADPRSPRSAAAQRLGPRQQFMHDAHRGSAEDHPRPRT
jgi:hypothetical protein